MELEQLINNRKSCRAFSDHPVDPQILRSIIARAARAPSNGNIRGWTNGGQQIAKFTPLHQSHACMIDGGYWLMTDLNKRPGKPCGADPRIKARVTSSMRLYTSHVRLPA